MTGCVVPQIQHLPQPHHYHRQRGVPRSRLQGTAFPGAQGLLGTGLYHEDIVLPQPQHLVNKVIKPHSRAAVIILAASSGLLGTVQSREQSWW